MDQNKVTLSGVAVSQPVLTKLPDSETAFTWFLLEVQERYKKKGGVVVFRPSRIRIETTGKSAEATIRKVREGERYSIDGYIKADDPEDLTVFRVRAFAIVPDESTDNFSYLNGIKKALGIMRKSRDLKTAIEQLEALLTPITEV